jgi:hypothetical protein
MFIRTLPFHHTPQVARGRFAPENRPHLKRRRRQARDIGTAQAGQYVPGMAPRG